MKKKETPQQERNRLIARIEALEALLSHENKMDLIFSNRVNQFVLITNNNEVLTAYQKLTINEIL